MSIPSHLEKGYMTPQRHSIMKYLYDMDLREHQPLLFIIFITTKILESGWAHPSLEVPQGSMFAVTLFIAEINSVTSCISNGVGYL